MAEGPSYSKPNVKAKGKNKKNKKGYGYTRPKKKSFKKSAARKCFHCNENGHWKRNSKIYLDLKRKGKEVENNK